MDDNKYYAIIVGLLAAIGVGLIMLLAQIIDRIVDKDIIAIVGGMITTFIIFYGAAKN